MAVCMRCPATVRRVAAVAPLLSGLVSVPASAEPAAASPAAPTQSLAVAPVRALAAAGAGRTLPAAAHRRGSRRCAGRGPSALGIEVPEQGGPSGDAVKVWAARAAVGALVVGRTTRAGRALGIDARLRDATTGEELGAWRANVAGPDDLTPAIERLAGQVVAALPAPRGEGAAAGQRKSRPSAEGFDRKSPISIHSSELEAFETDQGGRRFVFTDKVEVVRGNVTLHSDKLEAFYPPNAGRPSLVATGTSSSRRVANVHAVAKPPTARSGFSAAATRRPNRARIGPKGVKSTQLDTQRMFIRGGAQVRSRLATTLHRPSLSDPPPANRFSGSRGPQARSSDRGGKLEQHSERCRRARDRASATLRERMSCAIAAVEPGKSSVCLAQRGQTTTLLMVGHTLTAGYVRPPEKTSPSCRCTGAPSPRICRRSPRFSVASRWPGDGHPQTVGRSCASQGDWCSCGELGLGEGRTAGDSLSGVSVGASRYPRIGAPLHVARRAVLEDRPVAVIDIRDINNCVRGMESSSRITTSGRRCRSAITPTSSRMAGREGTPNEMSDPRVRESISGKTSSSPRRGRLIGLQRADRRV